MTYFSRSPISFTYHALLIFIINSIVVCYIWQDIYYTHDLADAIYNSKQIVQGKVPYRDFFHNHFVGYMYFFALLDKLFGLTPHLVAILQIVAHTIFCIFISLAAYNMSNSEGCARRAGYLSCTIGWFPFVGLDFFCQSYIIYLEAILLFYLTKSIRIYSRSALYCSFFVYSLMVVTDQRSLMLFPMLWIPLFLKKDESRFFFMRLIIMGSLLPILSVAYLYFNHALTDFFYQTVLYQFLHRNAGISNFSWIINFSLQLLRYVDLLTCLLACFYVLLFNSVKSMRVFILMLLLLSLGMVVAGGRPYENYFLFLSPVGILCLAQLQLKKSQWIVNVTLNTILYTALLLNFMGNLSALAERNYNLRYNSIVRQVSSRIQSISNSKDNVFVWGYCPQIYLYADRFTKFSDQSLITFASAIFHFSPVVDGNVMHDYENKFLKYIENSAPATIVAKVDDSHNAVDEFFACIFGSRMLESASGKSYFRERIDKHYVLDSKYSDATMTLGIFTKKDGQ